MKAAIIPKPSTVRTSNVPDANVLIATAIPSPTDPLTQSSVAPFSLLHTVHPSQAQPS